MAAFDINSYIESVVPDIYEIKGWKTDNKPYYKYEFSIEDKGQLVIGINNITSKHIYDLLKSSNIIDVSTIMPQYATVIDFYNMLIHKEVNTKFFCMIKIIKDVNNNTSQYYFCFIKSLGSLAIQIYQDSDECICLKNNLRQKYRYERNYQSSHQAYKDIIDYCNRLVDKYVDHKTLSFDNIHQFKDLISILRM